jgi:hypothetical protein
MGFLDWAALIVGTGLIAGGVRAIPRRQAGVPERYEGEGAVRLGWIWIGLGTLTSRRTTWARGVCCLRRGRRVC